VTESAFKALFGLDTSLVNQPCIQNVFHYSFAPGLSYWGRKKEPSNSQKKSRPKATP